MNVKKAVAFVRSEGNEAECARLDYMLTGKQPSQQIVVQLFAGQRADGGWAPFWAENYSSLDATCFRLAQAEQLGIGKEQPIVRRALEFLARRQAADGSYQEEDAVGDVAPPWAMPGDLSSTLYLTANCGLWLALLTDEEDKARRAASYLQSYLGEEGNLPSFLHAHWLAGGLWHKLEEQESAERVFTYLDNKLDDLAPSNLAWLLTTVYAAGAAASEPLLHRAALSLERAQEEDGRWPSEDGADRDVQATLEAVRALQLSGREGRS